MNDDRVRAASQALTINFDDRGGEETSYDAMQRVFGGVSDEFVEEFAQHALGLYMMLYKRTQMPHLVPVNLYLMGVELGKQLGVGEGAEMFGGLDG